MYPYNIGMENTSLKRRIRNSKCDEGIPLSPFRRLSKQGKHSFSRPLKHIPDVEVYFRPSRLNLPDRSILFPDRTDPHHGASVPTFSGSYKPKTRGISKKLHLADGRRDFF
jgi:hypothetical protein